MGSHRHAPEIEQGLGEASGRKDVVVNFTPHLMPMSRGILEVTTTMTSMRPSNGLMLMLVDASLYFHCGEI